MKRIIVSGLLFILGNTLLLCQETLQYKYTIGLSLGFTRHATNDQLLNYFNYSGNSILPVKIAGYYRNKKNLFSLNVLYVPCTLDPKSIHSGYYEYNYLKLWDIESNLEYFREVVQINQYFRFYIGVANNTYLTVQTEYFKNLLYSDAGEYRKSYDFSLLNLSPDLLIQIEALHHHIRIQSGFSLLNIAARPDDNDVKQNGMVTGMHLIPYAIKNYRDIQLSIVYQYDISRNIGFTAEYSLTYRSYSTLESYRYLSKSFLMGIAKQF